MINRAAVLLKYKEPAVIWINEADPSDSDCTITLADVNEERTVYLVADAEVETGDIRGWVEANWKALFESELEGWYTTSSLWPKKLTLELFDSWFTVECHSVIEDTVGSPIFDDDV